MINGVMNVYKERGFTSNDVVAKVRKIVDQKKVGHTGTLDPDAEGVLPVCLGRATRLCDMLTDKSKEYETVLLLGTETDTQDITGTILNQKSTDGLTESMIRSCIEGFVGEYEQIPPMYSAVKIKGKKLYEYAREGKVVERKARQVHIFQIDILEMKLPRIRMRIHCSKGTYVRTLCHDIGQRLGCGGCMEELLRTRVDRFRIADSFRLGEIEAAVKEGRLYDVMIPLDEMFAVYAKATVTEELKIQAYNGNHLPKESVLCPDSAQDKEMVRLYDRDGRFIGVYQYDAEARIFRLVKMYLDL